MLGASIFLETAFGTELSLINNSNSVLQEIIKYSTIF
jgi:hypothetical protein